MQQQLYTLMRTLDTAMLLAGPTMRARPKSAILTWKRGRSRSMVRSSSCCCIIITATTNT